MSGIKRRKFSWFLTIFAVFFVTTQIFDASRAMDDHPLMSLPIHNTRIYAEKNSHAEFNRTGVIQPELQFRAALNPAVISQFYYLSPKIGPPLTLLVSPCSGPISWSVSFVQPPQLDQRMEGSRPQTHWPVKQMIPGLPMFRYEGNATETFTIPTVQANLYRIDMKPLVGGSQLSDMDFKVRMPNTVLLYATSQSLGWLPGWRDAFLKIHQPKNRRRLVITWEESIIETKLSSYLLAVISGNKLHPPTLCAAENLLKKHPCPSRSSPISRPFARTEVEGLHCIRKNRLTLYGVKYNTTYYFTLYAINLQNNVSSLVAMSSAELTRVPPIILQPNLCETANLRKRDGFASFRYKPKDNHTTIFHILACDGGSVKAKIRAGDFVKEETIKGHYRMKAPPIPPGKKFNVKITASPSNLVVVSNVKIIAVDDVFPESKNIHNGRLESYRSVRRYRELKPGISSSFFKCENLLIRNSRTPRHRRGSSSVTGRLPSSTHPRGAPCRFDSSLF